MADFANRAAAEFAKDEVVAEPAPTEPSRPAPAPAPALSAGALFWVVIKAYFARIGQAIGLGRS
jgi:hypothetical protein